LAQTKPAGGTLKKALSRLLVPWRLRRGKIRRQKALLHFPPGCVAVGRLLREGDYEPEVAGDILGHLTDTPGAYLDIGAHVGLLSLPVLRYRPHPVFSVEASSTFCELMKKTRRHSPYGQRWHIDCAVIAAGPGEGVFYELPPQEAVYSGRTQTGRGSTPARAPTRTQQPLDELWHGWGRPPVAALKLDLEGGEIEALAGAAGMIAAHRPVIFLEWQPKNLVDSPAGRTSPVAWAATHGYEVFRVPDGVPVPSEAALRLASESTENFRLQPAV